MKKISTHQIQVPSLSTFMKNLILKLNNDDGMVQYQHEDKETFESQTAFNHEKEVTTFFIIRINGKTF